jgi:hypothetical protein
MLLNTFYIANEAFSKMINTSIERANVGNGREEYCQWLLTEPLYLILRWKNNDGRFLVKNSDQYFIVNETVVNAVLIFHLNQEEETPLFEIFHLHYIQNAPNASMIDFTKSSHVLDSIQDRNETNRFVHHLTKLAEIEGARQAMRELFPYIELFEVTKRNSHTINRGKEGRGGRRKQVPLGVIGIRCRLCRDVSDAVNKGKMDVTIPGGLSLLRTRVVDMMRLHYGSEERCPMITEQRYQEILHHFDGGQVKNDFWNKFSEYCKSKIGLVDVSIKTDEKTNVFIKYDHVTTDLSIQSDSDWDTNDVKRLDGKGIPIEVKKRRRKKSKNDQEAHPQGPAKSNLARTKANSKNDQESHSGGEEDVQVNRKKISERAKSKIQDEYGDAESEEEVPAKKYESNPERKVATSTKNHKYDSEEEDFVFSSGGKAPAKPSFSSSDSE